MKRLGLVMLAIAVFALAACSGGTSNTSGASSETARETRGGARTSAETTPKGETTMAGEPGSADGEKGRVTLAGGDVSFVPPEGFRPLTSRETSVKYPSANAPETVFANGSQSVSVAVTLSPSRTTPGQLKEFKAYLEQTLPRITPGLRWKERGFEEIGGRRWIHLEFTSRAIDTDTHNDTYITSSGDAPIVFNFNSTTDQYEEQKSVLEKSKNSIEVQC